MMIYDIYIYIVFIDCTELNLTMLGSLTQAECKPGDCFGMPWPSNYVGIFAMS